MDSQTSVFVRAKFLFNVAIMSLLSCQSILAADLPSASKNGPMVYEVSRPVIMVSKNQPVFIIKLDSNPSTGYTWLLRDYDKSVLVPVKRQYTPPDSRLMGASGYELWTFRVKQEVFTVPQRTTLRFIYERPWENSQNVKQTEFVITTSSGS